jgi:hypothetical protein
LGACGSAGRNQQNQECVFHRVFKLHGIFTGSVSGAPAWNHPASKPAQQGAHGDEKAGHRGYWSLCHGHFRVYAPGRICRRSPELASLLKNRLQ